MAFKYKLDPSPKKYDCPRCEKKRFVRYIHIATKKLAPPQFGKCDRADNCDFSSYPKDFGGNYTPIKIKKETKTYNHSLPPDLINLTLKAYQQNNFIQFLKLNFTAEEVNIATTNYKIGTARTFKGATLFWLIDSNQKVRTGKIMQYDKVTGNRIRQPKVNIDWIHSQLKRKRMLPNNYQLKQCLFGEHLVNQFENCNKKIAIVESEKSAIILSIIFPKISLAFMWI